MHLLKDFQLKNASQPHFLTIYLKFLHSSYKSAKLSKIRQLKNVNVVTALSSHSCHQNSRKHRLYLPSDSKCNVSSITTRKKMKTQRKKYNFNGTRTHDPLISVNHGSAKLNLTTTPRRYMLHLIVFKYLSITPGRASESLAINGKSRKFFNKKTKLFISNFGQKQSF